jgi:uncharacterized membrane protein (GlpM family)
MDLFWTMVILTFVLGALIVTGATVLGERLGTRVGGLIGTLPHLIIIALYFIGITQSPEVAARATVSVPATMGINALFLYVFYLSAEWNKYAASFIALGIWSVMALLIVSLDPVELFNPICFYLMFVVLTIILFSSRTKVRATKRKKIDYTPAILAVRGIMGGGVIAFSVVVAKFAGPVLGGIFSVFPALFLSTMLVYTFEHGPRFAGAMGKTMAVGGTSVVVYACCGYYLFPLVGMELGSLIGFAISALAALALYPVIKMMR